MKRKVIRERNLEILLLNTNQTFKLRVTNEIRFKQIANHICKQLKLDFIRTRVMFQPSSAARFNIPNTHTLRQVEFEHGNMKKLIATISDSYCDNKPLVNKIREVKTYCTVIEVPRSQKTRFRNGIVRPSIS
jgi:hypothetical protein